MEHSVALSEQVSQLGHAIREVRFRHLENLLFKLSANVVSISELCSSTDILSHCISWFNSESNRPKFADVLSLIDMICSSNASYIEYFLQSHFASFLHEISSQHNFDKNEVQLIQKLITLMVSSPKYNNNDSESKQSTISTTDIVHLTHIRDCSDDGLNDCGDYNWRFPNVTMIRSDVQCLFDISLRLKVNDCQISQFALLQIQSLIVNDFPPEMILQSETHLFEGLMAVLNRDDSSDLVNFAIECVTTVVKRLQNSLHSRCDVSIMCHSGSKFTRHMSHSCDDYQYPNEQSVANDNSHNSNMSLSLSLSLSDAMHQILDVCFAKLIMNDMCRESSFSLANLVFDVFISSVSSDSEMKTVLSCLKAINDTYLESVDISSPQIMENSIFLVQMVQFIAKCLQFCPKQCLNNSHIPSNVSAILASFATNVSLSIAYPVLHDGVISFLKYIDPSSARLVQYVSHVLTAMGKLTKLSCDMSLLDIRATLIALPFAMESTTKVIECVFSVGNDDDGVRECVQILLCGPSAHITIACIDCMIGFIANRVHLWRRIVSIDVVYTLVTIIKKHDKIGQKVGKLLELMFSKIGAEMTGIYQRLYPILSMTLLDSTLQGIVHSITPNMSSNAHSSLTNQFRICFHSNPKVRIESHHKITDYYRQICHENEEKSSQPISCLNDIIRQSSFDFFHCDSMKKAARKYQKRAQTFMKTHRSMSHSSFSESDLQKLCAIHRNRSLEYDIRKSAADQLSIVFNKNQHFWDCLRSHAFLKIVIESVVNAAATEGTKSTDEFIIVNLDLLKLYFESEIVLNCNTNGQRCSEILHSLLPVMFHSNIQIRYLFSCIAALIALNPVVLLCHSHRSELDVRKEKECYSPKLQLCIANDSKNQKYDHLFHIWIPKFMSDLIALQLPQHKIRWTSHHTKAFEHIIDGTHSAHSVFIDSNQIFSMNSNVQNMVKQHKSLENTKSTHKSQFSKRIANGILNELQNCKDHPSFKKCLNQIVSLFSQKPPQKDLISYFVKDTRFYSILERILSVAPLNSSDDEVFCCILKCVRKLLLMRTFPSNLLSKLNAFINEIYIQIIDDIPPSYTQSSYDIQQKEQKQSSDDDDDDDDDVCKRIYCSKDVCCSKVMVIDALLKLFSTFIVFLNSNGWIDRSEYRETLSNVIGCYTSQLSINPIAYKHVLSTNCLIHDSIRIETSLHCLLSILTMSVSVNVNSILADRYNDILNLLLDVVCRSHTPNSFDFKNQFRTSLVCLDFLFEKFVTDTRAVYDHERHLSWLVRFLSDRESITKALAFSIFVSLLQSCASVSDESAVPSMDAVNRTGSSINTQYPSSLKLILSKHSEFVDYMFGAIHTSSSPLVRTYALDCLRLILNLYLNYKNTAEKDSGLLTLIQDCVISKMSDRVDMTKLLHDVCGYPKYFQSVLSLLRTLIIMDIAQYVAIPLTAMHFARLTNLLDVTQYYTKYCDHLSCINVPQCVILGDDFMNRIWKQHEGDLRSLETASSILEIFNFLIQSGDDKRRQLLLKRIFCDKFMANVGTLLEGIVGNKHWEMIAIVFKFYGYLLEFAPKQMRLQMPANKWCSLFVLKAMESCLSCADDSKYDVCVCDLISDLCNASPDLSQKSGGGVSDASVSACLDSPFYKTLLGICRRLIDNLVSHPSQSHYWHALSMILSVSQDAKMICCYSYESGDFVEWVNVRLSQVVSMSEIDSIILILKLIQNCLFCAKKDIKQLFVKKGLGAQILKLYVLPIDCHLQLLAVIANFVSHCQTSKYVFLNQSKQSVLNAIVSEAFSHKSGGKCVKLCFEILESMMLSVDGIGALSARLLHKSVAVISSKRSGNHIPKICCMKLLRNIAMQSVGQTVLIKHFLNGKSNGDWLDMCDWLRVGSNENDGEFHDICAEFFRNLGFVTQFKMAFASNEKFIKKCISIIQSNKSSLQAKLALITLIWTIIHKNQKCALQIKKANCPSFDALIRDLQAKLNDQQNNDKQFEIIVNSIIDRAKIINSLLA